MGMHRKKTMNPLGGEEGETRKRFQEEVKFEPGLIG